MKDSIELDGPLNYPDRIKLVTHDGYLFIMFPKDAHPPSPSGASLTEEL